MIPVTCGDYARVLFTFAREAAGALGTGIPCALYFLGERFLQDSDASRREIAKLYFAVGAVIARSQRVPPSAGPMINSATKQSTLTSRQHGLLRFARNDDLKTTCVPLFES